MKSILTRMAVGYCVLETVVLAVAFHPGVCCDPRTCTSSSCSSISTGQLGRVTWAMFLSEDPPSWALGLS